MPTITDPINKINSLIEDLEDLLLTSDKKQEKNIDKAIKALGEKKGAIKELNKEKSIKAEEDVIEAIDELKCDDVLEGSDGDLTELCKQIATIIPVVLLGVSLSEICGA